MKDKAIGILGSFDGLTSTLGVLWTFALTGSYHGLLVAAISLAFGASVSMGGAEWLSEDKTDWGKAGLMAAAFLIGGLSPAIPFFIMHGITAFFFSTVIALIIVSIIAVVRPEPFKKSFVRTLCVLVIAVIAAVVTGLLANSL